MRFLIDSNVFIQAKNQYYHFDVVPGFWAWIEQRHVSGVVFSVPKVLEELNRIQDEVTVWASSLPKGFFIPPDEATLSSMSEIAKWTNTTTYTDLAKQAFLDSADYRLIAHAHGFAVVSQEVPAPQSKSSIKIPDACDALDVTPFQTFAWLREVKARF